MSTELKEAVGELIQGVADFKETHQAAVDDLADRVDALEAGRIKSSGLDPGRHTARSCLPFM